MLRVRFGCETYIVLVLMRLRRILILSSDPQSYARVHAPTTGIGVRSSLRKMTMTTQLRLVHESVGRPLKTQPRPLGSL